MAGFEVGPTEQQGVFVDSGIPGAAPRWVEGADSPAMRKSLEMTAKLYAADAARRTN